MNPILVDPGFLLLFLLFTSSLFAEPIDISWKHLSEPAGGSKGAVQLQSGKILATRTEWRENSVRVICSQSEDLGKTWSDLSIIAEQKGKADLGDGHLLQLPSGKILFSYRHHRFADENNKNDRYSIRIAESDDSGQTWKPHSTVATSSRNPKREPDSLQGLWASFLLLKKDGTLLCVYDDETTPHREGFFRHQWLTMKQWNPKSKKWTNPVTVSRAHREKDLSRDGMPTMVELSENRLIAVFESVKTSPPHANCIRFTKSEDGGKTWSWNRKERGIVFEAGDHLAISPWMVQLPNGDLFAVFSTDQDRAEPAASGTAPISIRSDLKAVLSKDGGETWIPLSKPVFAETHRSYMPGVLVLRKNRLLITFFDFQKWKPQALHGEISPEQVRN